MEFKKAIYATLFILCVTMGLSFCFGVAYIYTLCGLAAWVAFGHFITIDDDMPGEWSNPEGDKEFWRYSLIIVAVKFLVFIVIVAIALLFPALAKYGV